MILLGVDGGGTKTLAVVSTVEGEVLGVGRAGASNYQSVDERGAAAALAQAVDAALATAGASRTDVEASALGLAGFDGPIEATIVRRVVEAALGPAARRFVENDSLLVLRAGTSDGVGVGVVAGTGNNCIGRDRRGRRLQIGGMGPVSGDAGSAPDLALAAAAAAWRSSDGRLPPSRLVPALLEALSLSAVERLADLVDDGATFRAEHVPAAVTALFATAEAGDLVAAAVVEAAAQVLADNARAALRGLGLAGDDAHVVLGGRVLTQHTTLSRRVIALLAAGAPEVHASVVPAAPVVGALLWAHDLTAADAAARSAFRQRILASPTIDG